MGIAGDHPRRFARAATRRPWRTCPHTVGRDRCVRLRVCLFGTHSTPAKVKIGIFDSDRCRCQDHRRSRAWCSARRGLAAPAAVRRRRCPSAGRRRDGARRKAPLSATTSSAMPARHGVGFGQHGRQMAAVRGTGADIGRHHDGPFASTTAWALQPVTKPLRVCRRVASGSLRLTVIGLAAAVFGWSRGAPTRPGLAVRRFGTCSRLARRASRPVPLSSAVWAASMSSNSCSTARSRRADLRPHMHAGWTRGSCWWPSTASARRSRPDLYRSPGTPSAGTGGAALVGRPDKNAPACCGPAVAAPSTSIIGTCSRQARSMPSSAQAMKPYSQAASNNAGA